MDIPVIIELNGREFPAHPGDRFLDLLDDVEAHGLPIACRGGNCGTCRVRVIEGCQDLQQPLAAEQSVLRACNAASDERLGCQICIRTDPVGDRIRLKHL